MGDEPKFNWLLSGAVMVLVTGALISLAFRPVRPIGVVILASYWAIISYHFQCSLWYPNNAQVPLFFQIVFCTGALAAIAWFGLVFALSP